MQWRFGIGFAFWLSVVSYAENTLVHTMNTQFLQVLEQKSAYESIIGNTDQGLLEEYMSSWNYHSLQDPYSVFQTDPAYYAIGAAQPGSESSVRQGIAERIFRARFKNIVQGLYVQGDAGRALAHTQEKLSELNRGEMSLGGGADDETGGVPPAKLRYGYDVFTDHSYLEYSQGFLAVSFTHPALLAALCGTKPKLEWLQMRLGTQFGLGLPQAALLYRFNSDFVEASITQDIGKNWMAGISSVQPIQSGAVTSQSYTIQFLHSF